MTSMSREDAARALGMKTREVTDWDGRVALLFDGTRFAVNADGTHEQLRGMQPAAPVQAEVAPDPAVIPETPEDVVEVETVPDGSAAKVLAWVGDDPARVRLALEVERKDKHRAGLLADLEKLAAG